jgi:hypothetical protein
MWQAAPGLPLAYHRPLMLGSVPAHTSVRAPKPIARLAQIARMLTTVMGRALNSGLLLPLKVREQAAVPSTHNNYKMTRRSLTVLCLIAFSSSARAAEPPQYTFSPPPPGAIVQSRLVYLTGEAMHSQWRAVLSKGLVGSGNGTRFYQWFLSFYAIDGTVYHLKYRSPDAPVPFGRVTKAHGASLWFPVQDAKIAGAGELMGPGAQQLVLQSHEAAADCGTARVDVFFYGAAMQMVMRTLSVENSCSLSASVIHAHGDSLQLTGPFYAANAPLCCPTKERATATLRFNNGTWTEKPPYFKILK